MSDDDAQEWRSVDESQRHFNGERSLARNLPFMAGLAIVLFVLYLVLIAQMA